VNQQQVAIAVYKRAEVNNVLLHTTGNGFQLKIRVNEGDTETHWLRLSFAQVVAIRDILLNMPTPEPEASP
jgi:hypothetical protein